MTGFSNSKGQNHSCSWSWELKSVNSKGLDVRFRLPTGYENLEKKLSSCGAQVTRLSEK